MVVGDRHLSPPRAARFEGGAEGISVQSQEEWQRSKTGKQSVRSCMMVEKRAPPAPPGAANGSTIPLSAETRTSGLAPECQTFKSARLEKEKKKQSNQGRFSFPRYFKNDFGLLLLV